MSRAVATTLLLAGLLCAAVAVARAEKPEVIPYAAVVGGLEYETIQTSRTGDDREDRGVTLAMSRFGVKAIIGHGISLESEFEANAGPHGTSAWEGQAALSVRNQLVRVERGRWRLEAGRLTDPASIDFYCEHVTDQLLSDGYTRGSLLASGFNRGNGVQLRFAPMSRLSLGLTLNAANPVSTTSALVVGGTFPPFSRFYFAPYQYVGRDAANFPADEYHFVMFTPSAMWTGERLQAYAAAQLFQVNTNTSSMSDQQIDGYNLRAGVAGRLAGGHVRPFVNVSMVQNEVVDPDDGARLSGEIYTGTSFSMGADVDIRGRDGVGAQIALVRDEQGSRALADQVFVNIGATYWLGEQTAAALRLGIYSRCEDLEGMGCNPEGERSVFMTLRTFL